MSFLNQFFQRFKKNNFASEKKLPNDLVRKTVSVAEMKQRYQAQPTIANYLPWMEYDPKTKCFLLEDCRSVAIGFELEDSTLR